MLNTNNSIEISRNELLYSHTIQHIQSPNVPSQKLSSQIRALSPEELKKFVDRVVQNITQQSQAFEALEKFSHLLSTISLEEATKIQFPALESAIQTAKQMKENGSLQLYSTQDSSPLSSARSKISELCDFASSVIEGSLEIFGLTSLFESAPVDRVNKMILLFGLVTSISTILIPLLGPAYGILIMSGVALLLILAGRAYPSIRPMPKTLPHMENWSQQYREGKNRTIAHLNDAKFIADALAARQSTGKIPLIVGPSGVGKTTLVKSLIEGMELGKYPDLEGKVVHYVNAEKLKPESLDTISKEMGRHRKNIVLVFDNLDKAFETNGLLAAKMEEMLLDADQFPFVIGISTEEGSKGKFRERPALQRNIHRLSIQNPNEVQTQAILQHACLQHPEMMVDSKSLAKIHTDEKGLRPLGDSLRIFSKCVDRTSKTQRTPLENRVDALRQKILEQNHMKLLHLDPFSLPYKRKEESSEDLETELASLEADLKKEKEETRKFFALRKTRVAAKEKALALSREITEESSSEEKNLFLLLSHYFSPMLDQLLREEAERLHLKTELNEDLVQKVLEEEIYPS